jgi:aminobenzoyl-glutamate utilization protein B
MQMKEQKNTALEWVDGNAGDLSDWCSTIWHYGETAWREYKSAAWYVERLRAEGFEVEEGSGGMPTAFAATFSTGDGPVIGGYAEYDAVPGNCQAASTRQEPRAGLAAMEAHGIKGTLKFFGEPAEKVRGSKPIHAARGYYDGIDAFISFHPAYILPMSNTVLWDTHCGASYAAVYSFHCDEPENWLAAPADSPIPQAHSAPRAPGATDALVTMYTLTKMKLASSLSFQGGWSLSEAILTAGQATADNLPAGLAQIQYLCRTPDHGQAEQLFRVLDQNADAAARAAHCRWERHWVCKSREGLPNHAMAELTYRNLIAVGGPVLGDEAIAVARQIQVNLGLEPMEKPFLEVCEELIEPEAAERIRRQNMPPSQRNSTSDDYTEMCWHAPTVRLYIGRPMLKGPPDYRYPAWAMNALGGIPATIDPTVLCAAKVIGLTVVDLLTDGGALAAARREFEERTGGGIGGENWIPPLCDHEPPVHFRWPEYVTTERGEEWWIPAMPD